MSLKTTIRLPKCVNNSYFPSDAGLVGISSLDNYVYIWQIKDEESHSILIIYQVNPLVPSSWHVFKEIILDDKPSLCVYATFNAFCSKIAFRFRYMGYPRIQDELLMVDMASHQTEIKPVEQLQPVYFYQIAETVVGWVELVYPPIVCRKMFPESNENPVLFTLVAKQKQVALTYDSLMYIECSNNLYKVVSYDFLSGNLIEMAFPQWNPNLDIPYPFLVAASDRSYLIRPSEDQGQGNRVYKVQQDNLGITLTYFNQVDDQFIQMLRLPHCHCHWLVSKAVNDKIAVIQDSNTKTQIGNPKFLSVAHLGVSSLKSLAVWAVQKLYGTIGDYGELRDGISEEELKNSIGYQKNKKLF